MVLRLIHLPCHLKSLRQIQWFALQKTKFSNKMFAPNATCVVMFINFSWGCQSTDDAHILLLETTKISEQNPDSIDSFDMLSFCYFNVHQLWFQIIFINEQDHWHFSNSPYFMWEYDRLIDSNRQTMRNKIDWQNLLEMVIIHLIGDS